jgi:hypothetical protein
MPLQAACALATTPKLKMLNIKPNNFMKISPKVTVIERRFVAFRSTHLLNKLTLKITKKNTREENDALGANTPGHPLSNAFHAFDSPCIHAGCRACQ